MVSLKDLAVQIVNDWAKMKQGNINVFRPAKFFSLSLNGNVKESSLPYHLDKGDYAMVVIPFVYTVVTAEDSSAYVIFIDRDGNVDDSITINEWSLRFNEPLTAYYRTYDRHAYISKGNCLSTSERLVRLQVKYSEGYGKPS